MAFCKASFDSLLHRSSIVGYAPRTIIPPRKTGNAPYRAQPRRRKPATAPVVVVVVAQMQAEGWNPGFRGGTRIALRKLRFIRATLASYIESGPDCALETKDSLENKSVPFPFYRLQVQALSYESVTAVGTCAKNRSLTPNFFVD